MLIQRGRGFCSEIEL